jgi:hypothetical protein
MKEFIDDVSSQNTAQITLVSNIVEWGDIVW